MRTGAPYTVYALTIGCLAIAGAHARPAMADDDSLAVQAFRSKMEQWVETRQILSEERANWLAEKESLEATRDLLARERDSLRTEIKEFEESGADTDEERRELLLERAELQRSAASLRGDIAELEVVVKELAPQLPDPLQKKLELLLVQIPEDPESTKVPLGQRLISVLGVLAQSEKWNSTATLINETREVGGPDDQRAVRTLYWGLGQAFYVDRTGTIAGVGRPSVDGWDFLDVSGVEEDTALLLDIYEGNVDTISFVPMTVEIR